ncbi:hypothetical protein [Streptomyces sp. RP5T]|nr:hypothetical protein [Streptomyces sp. RP5T]
MACSRVRTVAATGWIRRPGLLGVGGGFLVVPARVMTSGCA